MIKCLKRLAFIKLFLSCLIFLCLESLMTSVREFNNSYLLKHNYFYILHIPFSLSQPIYLVMTSLNIKNFKFPSSKTIHIFKIFLNL